MNNYTYLIVNLACIAIPFAASFYSKHAFFKEWPSFFKANGIVAVLFIIWDYVFTTAGIWGFNDAYLTGIFIFNLPIEEILFFVCIPYACIFTFFAFEYLIKTNPLYQIESTLSYIVIGLLFIIGIFYYNKIYTSFTFITTSIFLSYLKYRRINLGYHYLSYLVILPFFFLSNGILTGSFFVEPIVWYNDAENLGIRITNIPVEDIIYGMLLIFLNIELFTYFRKSKKQLSAF